MANYIYYNKTTGRILGNHKGHPHDLDPLTKERQEEMKKMLYGDNSDYYNIGLIVSDGYKAIFFPDVVNKQEINVAPAGQPEKIREVDVVDLVKLNTLLEN